MTIFVLPGSIARRDAAPSVGIPRTVDRHAAGNPAPLLERALALVAPVRGGEAGTALLFVACVFAIMCAYYILKTAREGLILSGGAFGLRGDELKIYASGAMALLLVVIVPAYGRLASRVPRMRLIATSYGTVIACLAIFYVLATAGVPIGLPFFIWLGLVNVFLVAQFWSYANDVYSEEQGKRLFAMIATGGALGAIVGPRLVHLASTHELLLVAAALLAGVLGLFAWIERRQPARTAARSQPVTGSGGFALVLRSPYLLAIAAMVIVANLVNSLGEFLLSNAVADHAAAVAATAADRREVIKEFYGDFFYWVNLVSFLVQALLVSRLIARFGVRAGLLVLPLIALGTYGAIATAGGLSLVRLMKVAENATDYSVQNTVRQMLYLPTDRAVKYKAKAAIDTFFVRFGDTLSALVVLVGIHEVGLGPQQLALVNVALVALWLAIVAVIARHHRVLEGQAPEAPAAEGLRA